MNPSRAIGNVRCEMTDPMSDAEANHAPIDDPNFARLDLAG
jgi:hypothetical protein